MGVRVRIKIGYAAVHAAGFVLLGSCGVKAYQWRSVVKFRTYAIRIANGDWFALELALLVSAPRRDESVKPFSYESCPGNSANQERRADEVLLV
jgi:hypothetical protein